MKVGKIMKKLFLDLDGTLAKFNVRNALKRFDNEIGFFSKLDAYIGIQEVNKIAEMGNLYIISASPNDRADMDKMTWIKKYLPNIPQENITICRLGENKAEIIQKKYGIKIDKNCLLLDDYSNNLFQWEEHGGIGIKRLTSVADNSRGLWKGKTLKNLKDIAEILA
jgi:5'(3')-deoxyribonucleotidase